MVLFRIVQKIWILGLVTGLILINQACEQSEEAESVEDVLLAEVYNKSLYLSELKGLTPKGSTPEDSILIVNTFIENWIRESLLMHEAEKNVPNDLNIDELVRDYRASLIRYSYEKLLVELQLDSTVTPVELNAHYEENKDQYRLEDPILRCFFIKIPKEVESGSDLRKWWKSDEEEDYKRMVEFCSENATTYMLNDSVWYKIEDLTLQFPQGLINTDKLSKNRDYKVSDDTHHYFLRVFETLSANKYAPLAYVKDQATKLILHKRKIKLLEEKKEEMYERELRRNNVKIYLK